MKDNDDAHLALLLKVNTVLSSALGAEAVMSELIQQVIESLGAQRGFIVLRKGDDWEVLATHYIDPQKERPDRYFSQTIVSCVALEGKPLLLVDALRDEFQSISSVTLQGIRSVLCAPLRWGGEIRGVVYADSSVRAGIFNPTHLKIFSAITDQASRALENAALHDMLQKQHHKEAEHPPSHGIAFSFFGSFQVFLDGQPLQDWSTRKNRELLAFLAAHRGRAVHEEKLMELFWSQGGKKALHSLHNSVTQLRKVLGNREILERKFEGYQLDSHCWIDIEEFSRLFYEGRLAAQQDRWTQALPLLAAAERLSGAQFMEDCYSDWTISIRSRLHDEMQECRNLLAGHLHQQGEHLDSVRLWKRVLNDDRCCEEAYRGLMEAYRALGRRAEVARTYQECARAFEEELELPPPEDLKKLAEI